MFLNHRWPGNVRELQNAVQRLLLTPERALNSAVHRAAPMDEVVEAAPLSGNLEPLRQARREASDHFERNYLQKLLAQSESNIRRAAAIADVSRQMIQKLMRRHGF